LTIQDSERGARFVLRLPVCDPPPAADPSGSTEARSPSVGTVGGDARPGPSARGSRPIPDLRRGGAP
jgi:hypothetical protein